MSSQADLETTPEKQQQQQISLSTSNDLTKALADSFLNTKSSMAQPENNNNTTSSITQLLQQLQKTMPTVQNSQNQPETQNNPIIPMDLFKSTSSLLQNSTSTTSDLNQFGIDTSTMATHGRATILDKDGQPVNSDHQVSCRICGEFFADLNELRNHEHTKHANIPVYTCKVCKYCSLEKSLMIRHLRTHIGLRPFFCKQCGYAFTTKANCERHLRKRHNMLGRADLEQSIRCDTSQMKKVPADSMYVGPDTVCMHCDQKFSDYWSLRDHMRIHDKKNYRKFEK